MFTEKEAKDAIIKIAELQGIEKARLIEKMLRLETAHFKSKQYQITGSAGMEKGKWANLDESKLTYIQMNDNHLTGAAKLRTFIKWNNVLDFCLYLSDYIDRHEGNFARWNSVLQSKQKVYRKRVDEIKARFV
jgi:hypothetical protein